ncbi:DUF3311 domain-containing protein [Calidifontibacter terrae]
MTSIDDADQAPPANKGLLVLAGVLLVIPCLALVPVGWYASADAPHAHDIAGWPLFIWYQMLMVPVTAIFTVAAYIVMKKARPHVPVGVSPAGRHSAHQDLDPKAGDEA